MLLKEGVILNGLQLPMRIVLITADKIWKKYGHELVVTAGLDGTHSPGSLHYYGYALDLRIYYFSKKTQKIVAQELKQELPEGYDVILHNTHIHVEYDAILRDNTGFTINPNLISHIITSLKNYNKSLI